MRASFAVFLCACAVCVPHAMALTDSRTDELLERTSRWVETFWQHIALYDCRENVTKEKFTKNGKVDFRQKLEFDYLALTKARSENLAVEELRVPVGTNNEKPDSPPLLETNGFPTLLLIFHPHYRDYYRFQIEDDRIENGNTVRLQFRHLQGAASTSAVMVQGIAYPLELQGTAWIDSESGAIQRISASLIQPMRNINVEGFSAEVSYQAHQFEGESRWLPSKAVIELQTGLQHWRNTHLYSQYKRFTVETTEAGAK